MKRIAAGACAAALCVACDTGQNAGARNAPTPSSQQTAAAPTAPASGAGQSRSMVIGGVAACQPTGEVSALVSRWIELADADGNGQISKAEARSLTNFVIGGFFFRADTDGNGVVAPEEGRAARAELVSQYPALATLLSEARSIAGKSPFKAVADLIGVEYGKPLSADDARQAARAAMYDLLEVVDDDRDGTITPAEARTASWEAARSLGQRAFRASDGNQDGKLDLAEFQAAVDRTARFAFEAGDVNDNGSLTEQEAAVALGGVARRLGIPSPPENAAPK